MHARHERQDKGRTSRDSPCGERPGKGGIRREDPEPVSRRVEQPPESQDGVDGKALGFVPGAAALAAKKRRDKPDRVFGIVNRVVDAAYQRFGDERAIDVVDRSGDVVHRGFLNCEHRTVETPPVVLSGYLAAQLQGRPFCILCGDPLMWFGEVYAAGFQRECPCDTAHGFRFSASD